MFKVVLEFLSKSNVLTKLNSFHNLIINDLNQHEFKSITNEFVKIINLKINDDLKTLFDFKNSLIFQINLQAVSEDDTESDQEKLQQLQDAYKDASSERTSQQAYANSHEDLSLDAELQEERADAAQRAAAHTKMKRDAKHRRQKHAKNSEI